MLVDLVLAVDDQYWRSRRELPAAPETGTVLRVLGDPEVDATVVGSTCPLTDAQERSPVAAVLVRASVTRPAGAAAGLRRAGWYQLL